jgi:hypothetical protein
MREWAALAAGRGEADYQAKQSEIGKQVRCSQRYAGIVLKELRKRGVIELTVPGQEGVSPTRYRWALASTIPLVPYSGPDIEEDDPF